MTIPPLMPPTEFAFFLLVFEISSSFLSRPAVHHLPAGCLCVTGCLTPFHHHPCTDNALHKPSSCLSLSSSKVSPAKGDLESVSPKWELRSRGDHRMGRHASKQRVTINHSRCPREAQQSVWRAMTHQAQQPAGSTVKAAHRAFTWGSWEAALHAAREDLARLPGEEDSSANQRRVNACEVGKWSKHGEQHERAHRSKGESGT